MTYVEFLRVRGMLKVLAIVFAALFVLAIGGRIYMFSRGDINHYISGVKDEPGTTVVQSVLPDGTKRTVIDTKNGKTHITVDDAGYAGTHIEILNPDKRDAIEKSFGMGSVEVHSNETGNGERVTVDTNEPEQFVFYAAFAAFVSLIIATVLGAPFARENDGHLEIALTKPIDRIALALQTVAVDLAGIVAAWAFTVVFLVAVSALFQAPHITFGTNDLMGTILGILGAFAWYAILCAATSSMKRAYGIVLGLAWPFSIILLALAKADLGTQPILALVHTLAVWIGYILPFSYLHFGPAMTVNGSPQGSAAFSAGVEGPVLAALTIGYIAIAILQWRRVEA
jgi:hypothetical protein